MIGFDREWCHACRYRSNSTPRSVAQGRGAQAQGARLARDDPAEDVHFRVTVRTEDLAWRQAMRAEDLAHRQREAEWRNQVRAEDIAWRDRR